MERELISILDAIASGERRVDAVVRESVAICDSGDERYVIRWRGEGFRKFSELVVIARREGDVRREQQLRGIVIDGEVQYVKDPALLARFGSDDDAAAMAELAGFPQYPWALDVDGNRIPLLSARHPRPQRQHRPHPHSGRNGTFTPPRQVSEQSSGADKRDDGAAGSPLPPWHRDARTPAPAERVAMPALPNAMTDYLEKNLPKPPRVMSPLVADLMERAARKPTNPRPVDRAGRPTMPARASFISTGTNDPTEQVTRRN
jgi:hypothetical protein